MLASEPVLLQHGLHRLGLDQVVGRVHVRRDVVLERGADVLLGRLVLEGEALEGLVGGHKEGVALLGAVEELHEVVVLLDQGGPLAGLGALGHELVDGLCRLLSVVIPIEEVGQGVGGVIQLAEEVGVEDIAEGGGIASPGQERLADVAAALGKTVGDEGAVADGRRQREQL